MTREGKKVVPLHKPRNKMNVCFFFGPDKIPFSVDQDGMVEANSIIPFHGIISRGLLNSFVKAQMDVRLWHKYAHVLFDNRENDDDLKKIRLDAQRCNVLSFGKSALCAFEYVALLYAFEWDKITGVNLWNIKEGHTSSVWKTDVATPSGTTTFAINIARDDAAGLELKTCSEKMQQVGKFCPDINLAKVLDIRIFKPSFSSIEIVVTKNEWVQNAFEIHMRKKRNYGEGELLMVERFLTNSESPANITSVRGKIFHTKETRLIHSQINDFLNQAASCLSTVPSLEINDGDVVWNGEKAVIVAIS